MPSLLIPVPYAARIGGFEGFFRDVCAVLPGRGWQIHGIAVPLGRPPASWHPPSYWDHVRVLGKPWWAPRDFAAAFRREIDRLGPDIVMSYTYDHPLVCGPNVPPGPRVIERVGSILPFDTHRVVAWRDYFDAIISVSQGAADVLEQGLATVPESQRPPVHVITHGFQFPPATPPTPRPAGAPIRLIWLGRLKDQVKRVLDLVPIVEQLRARGIAYTLTILGEGPAEGPLRAALGPEIEAGRVRLLAAVPVEQVCEVLSQQDVFLSTSDSEGGPRTLIEAMSCNVVPVVTDISGFCREVVVDGENGFRVATGDVAAFADRIAALAGDRDLWCRLAGRCRPSVDPRFTLDHIGDRIDTVLRHVLAAPPRRRLDRADADRKALLDSRLGWVPGPVRRGMRRTACSFGLLGRLEAFSAS